MKALIAFAAFLFTLGAALAQTGTLPKIAKDMDYVEARKALAAQGFTPERLQGAVSCDKDDPRCFPEAFDCAGTGLAACVYTWKRGNAVIEVLTIGEQPIVDRVRCRSGC